LPHESQILVSDSETKTEQATMDDDEDYDLDGIDPPVRSIFKLLVVDHYFELKLNLLICFNFSRLC
jgi:hypothetical protein